MPGKTTDQQSRTYDMIKSIRTEAIVYFDLFDGEVKIVGHVNYVQLYDDLLKEHPELRRRLLPIVRKLHNALDYGKTKPTETD